MDVGDVINGGEADAGEESVARRIRFREGDGSGGRWRRWSCGGHFWYSCSNFWKLGVEFLSVPIQEGKVGKMYGIFRVLVEFRTGTVWL